MTEPNDAEIGRDDSAPKAHTAEFLRHLIHKWRKRGEAIKNEADLSPYWRDYEKHLKEAKLIGEFVNDLERLCVMLLPLVMPDVPQTAAEPREAPAPPVRSDRAHLLNLLNMLLHAGVSHRKDFDGSPPNRTRITAICAMGNVCFVFDEADRLIDMATVPRP